MSQPSDSRKMSPSHLVAPLGVQQLAARAVASRHLCPGWEAPPVMPSSMSCSRTWGRPSHAMAWVPIHFLQTKGGSMWQLGALLPDFWNLYLSSRASLTMPCASWDWLHEGRRRFLQSAANVVLPTSLPDGINWWNIYTCMYIHIYIWIKNSIYIYIYMQNQSSNKPPCHCHVPYVPANAVQTC